MRGCLSTAATSQPGALTMSKNTSSYGGNIERMPDIPFAIPCAASIHRLRVPGGWIVIGGFVAADTGRATSSMSMVYVPDAEHVWQVGEAA